MNRTSTWQILFASLLLIVAIVGCGGDAKPLFLSESMFIGDWQLENGNVQITYKKSGEDGLYERRSGQHRWEGRWVLENAKLRCEDTMMKLGSGEILDLARVSQTKVYEVVSVDENSFKLNDGNGNTETFKRIIDTATIWNKAGQ